VTAGQAAPVGVASSQVTALAQGTMKAMLIAKLKTVVAAVVILGTAAIGLQTQVAQPAAERTAAEQRPVGSPIAGLPAELQAALEANGAQLSPLSISYTERIQSKLSEQETFARLKIENRPISQNLFRVKQSRFVIQANQLYSSLETTLGNNWGDESAGSGV